MGSLHDDDDDNDDLTKRSSVKNDFRYISYTDLCRLVLSCSDDDCVCPGSHELVVLQVSTANTQTEEIKTQTRNFLNVCCYKLFYIPKAETPSDLLFKPLTGCAVGEKCNPVSAINTTTTGNNFDSSILLSELGLSLGRSTTFCSVQGLTKP